MDPQFMSAFGTVFGSIAGLAVVVAVFAVGRKIGKIETVVGSNATIATQTRDAVNSLAAEVSKLAIFAWGFTGENGARADLKEHERRLDVIERGEAP